MLILNHSLYIQHKNVLSLNLTLQTFSLIVGFNSFILDPFKYMYSNFMTLKIFPIFELSISLCVVLKLIWRIYIFALVVTLKIKTLQHASYLTFL